MKYINLILLVLLSVFFSSNVFSNENVILELQKGKKIIFIRHALAPGNGDPYNFDLDDCDTQRNLDERGIKQSKKIGEFFRKNNIPIDIVLSSEWCRCKDTARFAFGDFQTFNALNSFYDEKFKNNELKQLNDFLIYINNLKGDENLVFVTHYVVISSILGIGTSSGEIVITDKDLNIIRRIETM